MDVSRAVMCIGLGTVTLWLSWRVVVVVWKNYKKRQPSRKARMLRGTEVKHSSLQEASARIYLGLQEADSGGRGSCGEGVEADGEAAVDMNGVELTFCLQLESGDLQPIFNGCSWAGTVLWTTSVYLSDVLIGASYWQHEQLKARKQGKRSKQNKQRVQSDQRLGDDSNETGSEKELEMPLLYYENARTKPLLDTVLLGSEENTEDKSQKKSNTVEESSTTDGPPPVSAKTATTNGTNELSGNGNGKGEGEYIDDEEEEDEDDDDDDDDDDDAFFKQFVSAGQGVGIHHGIRIASQSSSNLIRLPCLRSANVVELGAGVGLPGFVAALLGAKRVTITEQPPLDHLLNRNLQQNHAILSRQNMQKYTRGQMHADFSDDIDSNINSNENSNENSNISPAVVVGALDWTDLSFRCTGMMCNQRIETGACESASLLNSAQHENELLTQSDLKFDLGSSVVDLILISDCIYEHLYGDSWKDLLNVLCLLCECDHTVVLNCVERRNQDGIDSFNDAAKKRNFRVEKLHSFSLDSGEDIELYWMMRNGIRTGTGTGTETKTCTEAVGQ